MTEQSISAPGGPEPGPDTFDFEAWLEGESTFPVFDHTVYLDQRSGAELARVDEEIEELVTRQTSLDEKIGEYNKRASNSFVDATLDSMLVEREELDAHLKALIARRDELREAIKKSAVTLTFQVKTPEELSAVQREAMRDFHKANPQYKNAKEDDLDYVTARIRHTLTAQIAHFCTGMLLHRDGREVPPPTKKEAEALLSRLISSEMARMMESISVGLSASQEWASKIDAGFPGRGSDVEEVRLDQDGAEGGEVLGAAATDDADRKAVGVD